MANNISLTASMRSNLLSLQNISRQVSSTQNKLATGNKVNSAIDNPSSYYTARSLNNRANDLDALLDSMGQAVSTIKAATTALETGATFLEQAAAVATSALETNTIPAKSYFEEKVGENGAVVTTAQELKDAIAAGKETIVVYGKIDYSETISLHANQKLVGTEYFTGYTGKEKFSQLNFSGNLEFAIKIQAKNTLVSDLAINQESNSENIVTTIYSLAQGTKLSNLDIKSLSHDSSQSDGGQGAIAAWGHDLELDGVININGKGRFGGGIFLYETKLVINSGSTLNLRTEESQGVDNAIMMYMSTVEAWGTVNIQNSGNGFFTSLNNRFNLHNGAILNISSPTAFALNAPSGDRESVFNFMSGSLLNIKSNDQAVYLRSKGTEIHSAPDKKMSAADFEDLPDFEKTDNVVDWEHLLYEIKAEKKSQAPEYEQILNQYDSIIKDSSYKGVNLLKDEKLNVRFNENGSADLNVVGKDMSSNSLGLSTVEWSNQGDIAQSLQEIASALKSIRAFTAELGNNYSIITNRQEFTENLINILTEGADKLTLADMNEESANMLSLQTRQQLAINSLSLASQASQSILKLF